MEKSFKILLINHSFQINYFSRRWELFAQQHPNVDVTLLAPFEYEWYGGKDYSYGSSKIINGKERNENNFHVRLFRVENHRLIGWKSPDFKKLFIEVAPDIIYHIGTHRQASLKQCIQIAKSYLPETKVIAFSMRGPSFNLKKPTFDRNLFSSLKKYLHYYHQKKHLKYVNKYCDAFFCHYPDAIACFRKEGYLGPIYMQTQVGVNPEWFHVDTEARKEIRDNYHLGDTFVFGSATRFTPDKGLLEVIRALPQEGDWKYLMMGSGNEDDTQRIKNLIRERGLDDKIILTGFVDWYDMAKYWNAIDCAIHTPRTTPNWEETFSLSIVQAMITAKPIIGNNSGSVPYQIGPDGIIVPEGDIQSLHDKLCWVMSNPLESEKVGKKMKERAETSFSINHLNEMFYDTLLDIQAGKYNEDKVDMTTYDELKIKK